MVPSEAFQDPVHQIAIIGRNLWVCTGNNSNAGTMVIYDLETGAVKTKVRAPRRQRSGTRKTGKAGAGMAGQDSAGLHDAACLLLLTCALVRAARLPQAFAAHKGEITCMVAGPGDKYMVTGGVDFQVKTWTPEGTPVSASGHHNKQVRALRMHDACQRSHAHPSRGKLPESDQVDGTEFALQVDCLLLTPMGRSGGGAGKIWSGSADATVYAWPDASGTGQIDSSGQSIRVDGGKRE